MSRLIQKNINEKDCILPLDEEPVSIGRNPDNDIVIEHHIVSRHHALLEFREDQYYVRDLKSKNGTYVNGIVVSEAALQDQDVIRIGRTQLVFDAMGGEELSISPEEPLGIIHQVGRSINRIMGEDDLLDMFMETILKIFRTNHGLILLVDKHTDELIPWLQKKKDEEERKPTISKNLVDLVRQQKLGVIVYDTRLDPRFKDSESIMASKMGSIMAVPMLLKDEVIGIIQVESTLGGKSFTKEELDLLISLSDHLALGVEQARVNKEFKKETRLRANLERFHSPEVVNKIIANMGEMEGAALDVEEKEATILFVDICGFTSLSERLTPVEIIILLNEYFTLITDIIFECDGTLDKYIGDAVMALFGVPYDHEGQSDRAVKAGLKIQEATASFRESEAETYRFDVKVGINTGNVVAGNIGSRKRMEYSVVGDAVNVASRLCSACKPGQILIGDRTKQLLTEEFNIEEIGVKELKGKKKGILVHEIK